MKYVLIACWAAGMIGYSATMYERGHFHIGQPFWPLIMSLEAGQDLANRHADAMEPKP